MSIPTMSKFQKTTLATALLLAAANTSAAGFQVSESSASGLGRAFAGEAAVADNAAVLARNPAAMTRFDRAELSVVGSYIAPDASVEGTFDPTANNDPSRLDQNDIIDSAVVPAFYYIQPINDTFAVGLAMFSGYGMVSDYGDDHAAGAAAGSTDLLTFNINPSVSFKATDSLSLGAGVSAVYAKATLERNYGDLHPVGDTQYFLLEGDAWGYGWNIGALYEFNENHRIGFGYRSQVDIDFEGDFTGATSGGNKIGASLELPLPATAEFSGYHKLTQAFAVTYSASWTQWSEFTGLEANSDNPNQCQNTDGTVGQCFKKEEHYDDNMRYSIGTELYLDSLTLRAGFALDEQAGETTLSIPDTDRYWYTAGATYAVNDDLTFDIAAAYIYTKEIDFSEATIPAYNYEFRGKGDAIIASAQMNYRF